MCSGRSRRRSIALITANNDGRADFASNPFNGPLPTFDAGQKLFCYVNNNAPGCLIRDLQELAPPPGKFADVTHSWQTLRSAWQRQFGTDMAFEADYVFTGSRNEHRIQDNVNIMFNPTTGLPLNFNTKDASGRFINRPFPDWGVVGLYLMNGRSNYNGLQTVFTKRMSHRWQGTLTYTLSTLERQRSAAAERAHRGAVRGQSGVRQRLRARGLRSAAPGRVQRHLGRCGTGSS